MLLDLAKAHILANLYLEKGGESECFNLSNGQGFSVKEIIKTAEKVVDNKIAVCNKERRQGYPAILVAFSLKAKEILGWSPEYKDIEKIIETAYIWHKYNFERLF